ncbi:MAG: efflux RND transporter permease subunit, partial [Planctomycetes bacterium]|nr:efflux RND transporter permease subunit [Planctomycetota bacterium]
MAAESPPTPHEIIAEPPPRPPLTPGAWLFLAHAGVLSPIVIYLFLGVWGIPFIAAVATPVALLFWFLNRLSDCEDRMSVSDEGVTLRVLRKGRPYGRPLSFRWDEVVKVTRWRAPGPKSPLLSVRLVKPKRPFLSWRLERPRPNPVRLGKALWQNPAFLDCLRRNVPPDRIKPEALDDVGGASRDAWWRRVCASVQILCAAVVAAAPVALATDSKYLLAFSMATSIICLVVSQGTLLFGVMVDWPFKPSVAVGALLVYVAVHPPWMLMAKDTLVGATQWPTFLGVVGGLAGLGLAAGVAMWTCPKWPLWRRVALLYALPALGFGAGWRGYDGIGDTKVGTGVIPAYLPWTPNGDGFLVREEESTFAVESRRWKETEPVPLKLRWYSADLERGHAVSLPNPGYTLAVGQEGALCATAAERGPTDLWFIPRRTDEAKKLLSLKGLARARLSPGRRYAVVRLNRQAKDGPW